MSRFLLKLMLVLVLVVPLHLWIVDGRQSFDILDFLADISVYYFLLIILSLVGQFIGLWLLRTNPDYAGMSFLGMGMVKMMALVIALLPKMLQSPPDKFLAINAVGLYFAFLLLDSWALITEINRSKKTNINS